MTGWADDSMPMSVMTVLALQDLGFSTDPSKADPYAVSSGGRRLRSSSNKVHLGADALKFDIVKLQGTKKKG